MKNEPQVTIAKPCSQNWEEMDKKDGFNFCQACSKSVIDFTGYSNAEIIKTLASASSEVCGRLTKNQLDQLNYHIVVAPSNRNWMKYLGVLAIGVSIFAINMSANAAKPAASLTLSENIKKASDEKKPSTVKKISGRILDANKKPIEGVRLVVVDTKYYATTDKNGNYVINFTSGINVKNNILTVESLNHYAQMSINFSTEKQKDLFLRDQDLTILGGMGYTPPKTNHNLKRS